MGVQPLLAAEPSRPALLAAAACSQQALPLQEAAVLPASASSSADTSAGALMSVLKGNRNWPMGTAVMLPSCCRAPLRVQGA